MKHVLSILGILFLIFIWSIPSYMLMQQDCGSGWGVLYIPIIVLTVLWGFVLNNEYFNN